MTDVLKIALDRRAELHEEVTRIDEFIRMADSLLRKQPARDEVAEAAPLSQGLPREVRDRFREPPTILPPETSRDTGRDTGREMAREAGAGTMSPSVTRMNLMRRSPTAVNG